MNKTINRREAGIISIIDSPGGQDELVFYVVSPELFNQALGIVEGSFAEIPNRMDIGQISNKVMDLLFDEEEDYADGVLEHDLMMSWGYQGMEYLNHYEIIGMLPIQTY